MIGRVLAAIVAAVRRALLLQGRKNNYLTVRISWVTCGLVHVLHSRRGIETGLFHVVSYKPDAADKRNIELIFKGHVEYGDARI